MTLFRPVGVEELQQIAASGFRAFPPRPPGQAVFCPVLNEEYARHIARDWNTGREPYAGFVTRFAVDDAYLSQLGVETTGAHMHAELWVPAEALDDFNAHIVGAIEVIDHYVGAGFTGRIDPLTHLPDDGPPR